MTIWSEALNLTLKVGILFMGNFSKLFKKVGGFTVLKQYAKAHVLGYALTTAALNGLSKKSLELVRLGVENKIYRKLQKKFSKFIGEYTAANPAEKAEQKHNPIIWTIWLQGMDQAPDVVQKCYASMQKNITDREIVVITEENFSNYVTFPDYIMEKYEKGIISKVHFADLLRVELLATHGGTWLDGTVFCSSVPFQKYVIDDPLFLFQTLKPGLDGHTIAASSWLMTAHSGNPIIMMTRALLHEYWSRYNYAVDYFILHNFIQMSIEAYPEVWSKVVPFSNETPHILWLNFFEPFNEHVWEGIKGQTAFHKLSYKFTPEDAQIPDTYYQRILNQ